MSWSEATINRIFGRGSLMASSAFFVFFSLIVVGFVFTATDVEYNLNQQIARGYITKDAVFFEPHDPSRVGAKIYALDGSSDMVTVGEDGSLELDLSPRPAEDPDYKFENYYLSNGKSLIETLLSSGGTNYLAALHDGNSRAVFYTGKIVEPPIVEGRFFTEEECLIRENLAVIGKDYKDLTYVRDGVEYLEFKEKEYRVIGVTSIASESTLDHMIFVNLGSLTAEEQTSGRFYIDGRGSMEAVFIALNKTSEDLLGVNLDRLETPTTFIDVVSGGMYLKTYLKVFLALLFVFIYLSIIVQIVSCQKTRIAVMSLCGISFGTRLFKVSKTSVLSSVLGIIVGIVTVVIIIFKQYFALPYSTLWKYLIVLSTIGFTMVGIMLAFLIRGMKAISLGEVLRQV